MPPRRLSTAQQVARRSTAPVLDLPPLLDSWELHLRAEGKASGTIRSYTGGVQQFIEFCERECLSTRLDRATLDQFVVDVFERGRGEATVKARQFAVRQFSAWLAEEGEIGRDELLGVKTIKLPEKITPRLTDEECDALISACKTPAASRTKDTDFADRRDEAMFRFMLETTVRTDELLAMDVEDVDIKRGIGTVRRGKGGKGRIVAFGTKTARALDRYLRVRRLSKKAQAGDTALWLSIRRGNGRLQYSGFRKIAARRAKVAGVKNFHLHLTRHTAAQRWLDAGGSEQGLMMMAGWSSRAMLDRYTKASANQRAIAEAHALNLGNF
jgi:site-specific recombinase XerD